MSKTYKIKVNQGQGEAKFVDIPVVGMGGKPLVVKAIPGGKYQLQDPGTGYAPENIRASRVGKNLLVFFEGRRTADLVIEDYYDATPEGFNNLIGEAESGRFYEYIPESASGNAVVSVLADGTSQVGMALGGAEINPAGAAVGTLVAAAGLNPLLLAPLALLGAAGGGGGGDGGGGGGGGDTPANNNAAKISIQQMSTDTGVAFDDFVTQGPVTEFRGQLTNFTGVPGDQVKLELLDKDGNPSKPAIEGVVKPELINGVWTWKWAPVDKDNATNLPESIKDGIYTLKASIVTSSGVALKQEGANVTQVIVVDNKENEGENSKATITIENITNDTGFDDKDWLTSDATLVFSGKAIAFEEGLGDAVKLELDPVKDGEATIVKYVDVKNGVWTWDAQNMPLAPGSYKLTASLVDKAGNTFTQTNAKVAKDLTIDTQAPAGDRGLKIVSMTNDSGFGFYKDGLGQDIDSSRDFKTNDTTPVFEGTLATELKSDELIWVQLLKGDEVVKSAFISSTGTSWEWAPSGALSDATYTLKAQVVDKAGNPAVNQSGAEVKATQVVVIDTNGPTDAADSNRSLKTSKILISEDTSGNGFVTQDGGNKDKISNNEDDKLNFRGELNQVFSPNGGKVLIKIVDNSGVIKSSAFVDPKDKGWSYQHIGALAEGQYVAKTILMDVVGNIIGSKDQSFFVDISNLAWSIPGSSLNTPISTFNNYSFGQNEYGFYKLGDGKWIEYTGGSMDLGIPNGTRFEPGKFNLSFKDQAGNVDTISNKDMIYIFENPATSSTEAPKYEAKDFTGKQTLGSVGKLTLQSDLDMASLYDGIDSLKDQGAANHLVMGSEVQNFTLKISLDDVLTLGVTNSFSIGDAHKGKIQMLIDGQAGDEVVLTGLKGSSGMTWNNAGQLGLFNQDYFAYTNDQLGTVVFIHKDVNVL